ncbi:protein kinase domain-containing protein [Arenimonas terrae]|jgi:serine/threonine protein kinase/tetratricopeptide (TPR) repeat protein|nr:serine/threonine-protein kinase [Arenimonas terrae]
MPDSASRRALDQLLDELLDLTPADRARRLNSLREREPAKTAELERLLAFCLEDSAELGPGGALASGLAREALLGTDSADEVPAGTEIGPYVIETLIGRGGMAEVYRASRAFDGFAQSVALKLVRSDRVGGNLRERLLGEQRALVRLEHPNIARFLDAGVGADGNVYLAMELVDGLPVTAQAEARKADLKMRVRWIIDLCDALEHAHSQLVVHCDIKPSNVLVDRGGRLRLLDFGIASLMTEVEPSSDAGLKLFTPDCAAPEQVSGGPVGTATDVFQVGALLYRLLVGQSWLHRPDLQDSDELAAVLHESATAPSLHLRAAADDPQVRANALACGFPDAAALARRVDERLDAIVLKCLARAPTARYANVAGLRADLRAWLGHRPVSALVSGRWVTGRLWLRRNGREAAIAFAGVACLVLLTVVYVHRVTEERDAKARELQRAQAVEGFLGRVFEQASPYLDQDSDQPLQTLVAVGDSMLSDATTMDPRTRFSLSTVLARLEMDQGRPEQAERRARAALQADGAAADALARLRLQRLLAEALAQQDRAAEALDVLRDAVATGPGLAELPPALRATLQVQLGGLYESHGRLDEATAQYDAAFDVLVSPDTPLDGESLQALQRLANNIDFGQRSEDLARVKAILARVSVAPAGESTIQRARRLQLLGFVEGLDNRPIEGGERSREAAQVLAAALGPTHRQVSEAWGKACVSFINGGGMKQAHAACTHRLELEIQAGRPQSSAATNARVNLSALEFLRGDIAASGALMRTVLEGVNGDDNPGLYLYVGGWLSRVDLRQGRYGEALARLDGMLRLQRRSFADNHDQLAEIGANRAEVLIELGRLDEAAKALDESDRKTATGGLRDRVLPARLITRGRLAAAQGRHREAVDLVEQGLDGFARHEAVSPSEMGWALLDAGEALLHARDPAKSLAVFEQALATGLEPDWNPGLWAWAVLRIEELAPGRYGVDELRRAVALAEAQFGPPGGQAAPCLRRPPALGGRPGPEIRARTTCL